MIKPLWSCLTEKGHVREENEDACFVPDQMDKKQLEQKGYLFAVADGMGGHEGGKIASSTAVKALDELYRMPLKTGDHDNKWKEEAIDSLKTLVARINHYIYAAHYLENSFSPDMASTLAGVLIRDAEAIAFNVGDSRIYHFSAKSGFRQISKDHSKTQVLVEQGLITAEGARSHPESNIVTRYLGSGPEKGRVEPDIFPFSLQPGDQILICSDGLTDMVEEDLMAQVMITTGSDLDGNARRMVDEALKKGGYDNITLILIQMQPEEESDAKDPAENSNGTMKIKKSGKKEIQNQPKEDKS